MSRLPQTIRVISNISAKSYGTETNTLFREGIHRGDIEKHKFLDAYSGVYRVPEMRWYILKVSILTALYFIWSKRLIL
jgi:hypothetical protein